MGSHSHLLNVNTYLLPRHGGTNVVLKVDASNYANYGASNNGQANIFFVDGHVGQISAHTFAQFDTIRGQYIAWN